MIFPLYNPSPGSHRGARSFSIGSLVTQGLTPFPELINPYFPGYKFLKRVDNTTIKDKFLTALTSLFHHSQDFQTNSLYLLWGFHTIQFVATLKVYFPTYDLESALFYLIDCSVKNSPGLIRVQIACIHLLQYSVY